MYHLLRENIRQIIPYSSARSEYKGDAKIFLDANESPYHNEVNRYPDPKQINLKQSIAHLKNIDIENIFLGNGSDEVLDLLFRAYCNPGIDNVITLPPTYGMYQVLASINNVENKCVPLVENFQIDIQSILKTQDDHTKIIFVCSPNNPTGNCMKDEDIEQLITLKDTIVVIDEAYIDFANKPSFLRHLDKYKNLVICQTLSKAYGMAGLRIGMCFASNEIIGVLNKIKPPYNINTLSQTRAFTILEQSNYDDQLEEIIRERNKLAQHLLQLDYIIKVYPSDANFLLVKVDDAISLYDYLLSKGIIIRNRSSQYACENCLRITIGTEQENKSIINALNNFKK